MELLFKIAGIGLIVTVLNMLLSKAGRDEQALLLTMAGLITVLLFLLDEIKTLFSALKSIF